MRRISILVGLCCGLWAVKGQAQNYDQQLQRASAKMGQQDYCGAVREFQVAFADSTKAGPFDVFAGTIAAANCPAYRTQALQWLLRIPRFAELSVTAQDVRNIAQEAGLRSLYDAPQWHYFLAQMQAHSQRREKAAQQAAQQWLTSAQQNALPSPARRKQYGSAVPGFARYTVSADTVRAPYLVYVPQSYDPTTPAPLLVYLHGGVASATQFRINDPGVAQEPIFRAAEEQRALVLYPYGRKSFGWVEHKVALAAVRQMVAEVQARYHVNARRIYLGGMSNGGTAAFWYACQQPRGFAGFYALSAMPVSSLGPLRFQTLASGPPLYSLNAEDDDVFPYQEVAAIYQQHSAQAPQWHFESRSTGGHGFLYGSDGLTALQALLVQLMGSPTK
ncbi:alpha/beta hydrolase-fold protein [Hymenobacter sp. 5516J-16]|uniref:alpha/beta hydrolase-fold protein n=1 Tax=Hymenobacter sp. 5516J-16 TaxID=2932253 RepID=UPI001FD12B37|nr:dienelactone hydrolase family protein [Hymenobacter sp. 5516J-16]UOQ77325.1 alpha/beta hydrolase-fold protein [Hymenobacter sp. 5516J-16]